MPSCMNGFLLGTLLPRATTFCEARRTSPPTSMTVTRSSRIEEELSSVPCRRSPLSSPGPAIREHFRRFAWKKQSAQHPIRSSGVALREVENFGNEASKGLHVRRDNQRTARFRENAAPRHWADNAFSSFSRRGAARAKPGICMIWLQDT